MQLSCDASVGNGFPSNSYWWEAAVLDAGFNFTQIFQSNVWICEQLLGHFKKVRFIYFVIASAILVSLCKEYALTVIQNSLNFLVIVTKMLKFFRSFTKKLGQ